MRWFRSRRTRTDSTNPPISSIPSGAAVGKESSTCARYLAEISPRSARPAARVARRRAERFHELVPSAGSGRRSTGRTGDVPTEHRADLAHRHPGHDLPVAVAFGAEPARHPEAGVDHDDLLGQPAEPGGGADQAVLRWVDSVC
jgi:hypothetical protein